MIRNFLTILIKFGSAFLFVLLEIVCLYLIVNYNQSQSEIWVNSSNILTGSMYEQYNNFTSFLSLRDEMEKLAEENAALRSTLLSKDFKARQQDSIVASNFEFIPALIVSNSTQSLNNKIILNKGEHQGIKKGMGVISSDGVIGVVLHTSENYSTVLSILNIRTKVSGLIKRTGTLGDVTWRGKNPAIVELNSIPQYVPVVIGDTVVTSGYSTVFPKGQKIGLIENVSDNPRTGYFDIDVSIFADLSSLAQVYVVKNIIFDKIKEFEKVSANE